ncbi:MAG: PorT family protein [Treponema sp.]|jgi:hypothetical protein|nr:PorT family protein [Treponema sp.]
MTGKSRFLPGAWLVVVLSVVSVPVSAQAPANNSGLDSGGKAFVAVLPLAGEETEMIRRFHDGIMESVIDLQKYNPRVAAVPPGSRIPTDMPPVPSLAGGARYALTGGVYPGEPAGEYYLQLWLWDMAGSTMIYTDDLVYDDINDAMESLPGLVEWLFSHIHELTVQTPADNAWPDPLFVLGARAGLSRRWYVKPDERSPGASALNLEGGVSGTLRLNSLFSVQLELLLTGDTLVYRGLESGPSGDPVLKNKKYTNVSLEIPVLGKMNFRVGGIRLSPLAGFYASVPLGKTEYRDKDGQKDTLSWSVFPLGFTAGLEGAMPYGPGMVIAGLRYNTDLGAMSINGGERKYRRNAVSLYLGYEFGFFEGKRLF